MKSLPCCYLRNLVNKCEDGGLRVSSLLKLPHDWGIEGVDHQVP